MSNPLDLIEIISSALVREYLSTKGFFATLKHMDIEYPRCNQSINSRQTLARALGFRRPSRGQGAILESLVRRLLIQKSSLSCKKETIENNNSSTDICSSTYNFPPETSSSGYDVCTQPHCAQQVEETLPSENFVEVKLKGETIEEKTLVQNFFPLSIEQADFTVSVKNDSHEHVLVADNNILESSNSQTIKQEESTHSNEKKIEVDEATKNASSFLDLLETKREDFFFHDDDSIDTIKIEQEISNKIFHDDIVTTDAGLPSTAVVTDELIIENDFSDILAKDKNCEIIENVKEIQNISSENQPSKREEENIRWISNKSVNNEVEDLDECDKHNNVDEILATPLDINLGTGDGRGHEVLASAPLLSTPIPDGATPLALPAALQLKTLIFGDAEAQFPSVWREGGIMFHKNPKLGYGLQLDKDGPCGALAALQGFVLKALLFPSTGFKGNSAAEALQPDPERAKCALVTAVSDVLWQCGQRKQACLAIPTSEGGALLAGNGRYRRDGVTEALRLLQLEAFEDLRDAVENHLALLQAPGGCALFLCSAILSRGLSQTAEDMGDACAPLLVRGGECAPELVSLVLTGRASMRDEKQGDERLRNVPARADIGLLTLAEYYGQCQVGSFLKTPRYPIWLVLAQGHYSVIFSTRLQLVSDWRAELAFRLHLFTGTAQRRPLQLAVETGSHVSEEDERALSPVEMVIRTKWNGATIKWIDT